MYMRNKRIARKSIIKVELPNSGLAIQIWVAMSFLLVMEYTVPVIHKVFKILMFKILEIYKIQVK